MFGIPLRKNVSLLNVREKMVFLTYVTLQLCAPKFLQTVPRYVATASTFLVVSCHLSALYLQKSLDIHGCCEVCNETTAYVNGKNGDVQCSVWLQCGKYVTFKMYFLKNVIRKQWIQMTLSTTLDCRRERSIAQTIIQFTLLLFVKEPAIE